MKILKNSRLYSYILVSLIALLAGFALASKDDSITPFIQAQEIDQIVVEEKTEAIPLNFNNPYIFADIAARVDAAVVLVTSEIEVQGSSYQYFPFNDPFFEFFFGEHFQLPDRRPQTQEGYGSGFIVSEDGYVVTNEHVVHDAVKIMITVSDHDEPLPAEVIWSDYDSDLAILKINADRKFQTVKLGDSDSIRPGEPVLAIGNPFGYEHTVTQGVISALGRPISIRGDNNERPRIYSNLIQTDAAINPGNSGGPLLNIKGEVIGINTAVSLQGQGIGFAIPINEVKSIVKDLQETGEIIRPWLGIQYKEMDKRYIEEYKEYYGLKELNGVTIIKVITDSPAEKAGLRANDIITKIDDVVIEELDDVANYISKKNIGDKIKIEVVRDGYSLIIFAEIGKRPNQL